MKSKKENLRYDFLCKCPAATIYGISMGTGVYVGGKKIPIIAVFLIFFGSTGKR